MHALSLYFLGKICLDYSFYYIFFQPNLWSML
jgi:hypothetical protein